MDLNSFFGRTESKYNDQHRDLYEGYLQSFENEGFTWGWIYKDFIKKLRTTYLSFKSKGKELPPKFPANIPVGVFFNPHGRVFPVKGKKEIDSLIASFSKNASKMTGDLSTEEADKVIGEVKKQIQQQFSHDFRMMLPEYFPVFSDDIIRIELKEKDKTLLSKEGAFSEIFIECADFFSFEPPRGVKMLSVNIKLVSKGESRKKAEDDFSLEDTDQYVSFMTSPDKIHQELLSLPDDLFSERLSLFGFDSSTTKENLMEEISKSSNLDLGFKNASAISMVIKLLKSKKHTNEDLLNLDNEKEIEVETEKAFNWLSRENPDGI